jgi:hypothetical protein
MCASHWSTSLPFCFILNTATKLRAETLGLASEISSLILRSETASNTLLVGAAVRNNVQGQLYCADCVLHLKCITRDKRNLQVVKV